tara:strand:- start:697 stop:816 length:120 start_codon:yes stop_codon:yes gene_type:complete
MVFNVNTTTINIVSTHSSGDLRSPKQNLQFKKYCKMRRA